MNDPVGQRRLLGRVVEASGSPAAGATVSVSSVPRRHVTTEPDGSFSIGGLLPQDYTVWAALGDATAEPTTVTLARELDPLVLTLAPASAVEVTVVDAESLLPITGARVELDPWEKETDDTGRARFRGVPRGWVRLFADAPGHGASGHRITPSGRAGEVLFETIALARGAPVSGRVVDERGAPVAGAELMARPVSGGESAALAAQSDEAGSFRIDALPRGRWALSATSDRFLPGALDAMDLDGRTERNDIVITLRAGEKLSGRIVDVAGRPVSGGMIRLSTCDTTESIRRDVAAGDDGRFEATGLPRDCIDLIARRDTMVSDIASVNLAKAPARDLVLTVSERRIAGTVVTPAGAPVPSAFVHSQPSFKPPRAYTLLSTAASRDTYTDANGRFELRGLGAGSFELEAHPRATRLGDLRSRYGKGVEARDGDENVRLVLDPGGAITGRVLGPGGAPVESFSVAVGQHYSADVLSAKRFGGDRGSFTLEELPTHRYVVTIVARGFPRKTLEGIDVQAGKTVDLGTIPLDAGRTLRGRVRGAEGAPVAGARVVASHRLRRYNGTAIAKGTPEELAFDGDYVAMTGVDGRYTITGVEVETLVVVADHDELGRSPAAFLPEGRTDLTQDLTLLTFAALEGRVTQKGVGLSRASVDLRQGPDMLFSLWTAEDGSYRFDHLAPGAYELVVELSFNDGKVPPIPLLLPPGKTTRRDVELP